MYKKVLKKDLKQRNWNSFFCATLTLHFFFISQIPINSSSHFVSSPFHVLLCSLKTKILILSNPLLFYEVRISSTLLFLLF